MSIAFPALLIFILVLPGIILRYTYARGLWSWESPTSTAGLSDEIAYGVVFAVSLHVIWVMLAASLGFRVDLTAVFTLLTGAYGFGGERLGPATAAIAEHPGAVVVYFLTLYAASGLAGYGAHRLVRALRLDRKTRFFRFRNEWYYLLSGEVLEFAESPVRARPIDGVYLTAVVDHGGESYLYRGIVRDFTFDRAGRLDLILLELAHRRRLEDDRPPRPTAPDAGSAGPDGFIAPDDRYYDIDGDLFILRYAETRTINLDYFALTAEAESAPAAAGAAASAGAR